MKPSAKGKRYSADGWAVICLEPLPCEIEVHSSEHLAEHHSRYHAGKSKVLKVKVTEIPSKPKGGRKR